MFSLVRLTISAGAYAGRAKIDGATLTIHAVTQKDSGEYRCEVTASEDHVNLGEASVTLNVLGMKRSEIKERDPPLFCNLPTLYPSLELHLSSLLVIGFSTLPTQCHLTSRPAKCRAQCSWALGWSFSVRTSSASLLLPIAGTKTTGL